MAVMVKPVEQWIDYFSSFTDIQILNPDYALSRAMRGQLHCKLCDRVVSDSADEHMAAHRIDLEAYRIRRKAQNADSAGERLAEARRLKAEAKLVAA